MIHVYVKPLLLLVIILFILTACGGKEPQSSSATASSSFQLDIEPSATPRPTIELATAVPPTTTSTQPVSSLEEVRSATVRVAFEGSFLHYEVGEVLNLPNHGSGFIISPDGTAVTNNHVVTGAAFLEVWLEGEKQPRNAKVLGVSECADLAVIDIDGEGFPYLDWYTGPISIGMDIYAAGYPLYGNEEFTLTRGVVSKEKADGETNWASIDSVIEIDANIQGGNSGGPLVTKEAQVVAVNYAGNNETRQNFSISRDIAMTVVEQLRTGHDVDSIGVNGEAIVLENGLTGIWVSSVSSGSAADKAGVEPGDIITHLEGLALATDGTLADYCDILRSYNPTDTLTIDLYRFLTDETLTGQLNGQQAAEENYVAEAGSTTTTATAVAPPSPGVQRPNVSISLALSQSLPDAEPFTDYTPIRDDTGTMRFKAPTHWTFQQTEIESGGFQGDGISLTISTSNPATHNIAKTKEATFTLLTNRHNHTYGNDPLDLFATNLALVCNNLTSPVRYNNPNFGGYFTMGNDCYGSEQTIVTVTAIDHNLTADVNLWANVHNYADLVVIDRILNGLTIHPGN